MKSRALSFLACALLLSAHAGEPVQKLGTPFLEEAFWAPYVTPQAGRIHALLNFEASDHYVTTRGLVLENQALIFQPSLYVYADLYSQRGGFLNDVLLTGGTWGSWHERRSGFHPNNWNEIDVLGGLTFTCLDRWKLSAFYTAYLSETHSYPTAWNLDLALAYDDTTLLGAFALHPYIQYSRETEGKTSVVFRPDRTDESYSFQFGIDPAYTFKKFPVKIEFPIFFTLVPEDYYQRSTLETKHVRIDGIDYRYQQYDGAGGGSGLGYFSTTARVSAPLTFIPKSAGQWTVYAAVQYYRFNNPGLLDGNQVLGIDAQRDRDLVQFHGGLSIYF